MYTKRTTRDWIYLCLALFGPFAVGFAIGGGAGGTITSILLAWGLVIYEFRMYRLTPAIDPKWTAGDIAWVGFVAVAFLGLVAQHVWAAGMIMVALVFAARNYRTRRQWDTKLKGQAQPLMQHNKTPSS